MALALAKAKRDAHEAVEEARKQARLPGMQHATEEEEWWAEEEVARRQAALEAGAEEEAEAAAAARRVRVEQQYTQRELTRLVRRLAAHKGMAAALDSCPDLLIALATFIRRMGEQLFAPASRLMRTGMPVHNTLVGGGGLLELIDPQRLLHWCVAIHTSLSFTPRLHSHLDLIHVSSHSHRGLAHTSSHSQVHRLPRPRRRLLRCHLPPPRAASPRRVCAARVGRVRRLVVRREPLRPLHKAQAVELARRGRLDQKGRGDRAAGEGASLLTSHFPLASPSHLPLTAPHPPLASPPRPPLASPLHHPLAYPPPHLTSPSSSLDLPSSSLDLPSPPPHLTSPPPPPPLTFLPPAPPLTSPLLLPRHRPSQYRLAEEREPERRHAVANLLERGARRRQRYAHWAISQLLSLGPLLPIDDLSQEQLETELARDSTDRTSPTTPSLL